MFDSPATSHCDMVGDLCYSSGYTAWPDQNIGTDAHRLMVPDSPTDTAQT